MTIAVKTEDKGMGLAIDITGVASAAAGGQGALANPEGVNLLILRSYLYVDVASTGAANIDVGIGAAAATDATDIINALAMNGAIAGKVYNGNTIQTTTKTEVSAPAVWTPSKFLCITGSASLVGLKATLYIEYVRAP